MLWRKQGRRRREEAVDIRDDELHGGVNGVSVFFNVWVSLGLGLI